MMRLVERRIVITFKPKLITPMKKILLSLFAASAAIVSQAQVYVADTAMTTGAGPGGTKSSSISLPLGTNYGINFNRDATAAAPQFFAVGDDFVVPTGQTWNIDTVVVYGYETGSTAASSAIDFGTLQIRQTSVTGTVKYGDTTTNVWISSKFSGIYRNDTMVSAGGGPNNTQRPIMEIRLKVSPRLTLTAGTYWLIYSARGASGLTGPWANPKVSPNKANPAGQNGMQRVNGVWQASKDSTAPTKVQSLGFPFKILGPAKVGVNSMTAINAELRCLPNPAIGQSQISFSLATAAQVNLRVLNATGQVVKVITQEGLESGLHSFPIDASNLPSGNYFAELQTENGRQTSAFQVAH